MANIHVLGKLDALIREGWLDRALFDALAPFDHFRALCSDEPFEGGIGETKTRTRRGLIIPSPNPIAVGTDPGNASYGVEQWAVAPKRYGKGIETNLEDSVINIINTFMADSKSLFEHAGATLGVLARQKLFNAYLGGNTSATAAQGGGGSTSLPVKSCAGFYRTNNAAGQEVAVGVSNPIAITIGASTSASVTGVTPDDSDFPNGPGTLTLAVAKTWSDNDAVRAANRPLVYRPGGALSTEGLTSNDTLDWATIRSIVQRLRTFRVPTYSDGHYYCFLSHAGENQLLSDLDNLGLALRTAPGDMMVKEGLLGVMNGVAFVSIADSPTSLTVQTTGDDKEDFAGTLVNEANVEVHRALVVGQGAITEDYMPQENVIEQASSRQELEIGSRQKVINRVRWIFRPPMDKSGEIVTQTWRWTGDFGIPADTTAFYGRDLARFKRAIVAEHAGS